MVVEMKVGNAIAAGVAGGIALTGLFYYIVFSFMQVIIQVASMLLLGGKV